MTGLLSPGSLPSRMVAVSLAVLVVALMLFGLVLPVRHAFTGLDERIDRSGDALGRYMRSLPAAEAPLPESAAARSGGRDGLLLSGTSEAVAAAQVQRFLKQVIATRGGILETIQVETAEALEGPNPAGLRRIGLKVRARMTVARLQQVLHDVETGTPYLIVDGLMIRRKSSGGRGAESDDRTLDVQVDVFGLWRPVDGGA